MAVLDAIVPFAVVIVLCVWQLWALRRRDARDKTNDAPRDAGEQ